MISQTLSGNHTFFLLEWNDEKRKEIGVAMIFLTPVMVLIFSKRYFAEFYFLRRQCMS